MFNRTKSVISTKNKFEKAVKSRRRNEINTLKSKSIFKAKLYDELKHIEVLLNDPNITAVQVTVPEKSLAMFSTAIYSADLASYEVIQVEGETNQFIIKNRAVDF